MTSAVVIGREGQIRGSSWDELPAFQNLKRGHGEQGTQCPGSFLHLQLFCSHKHKHTWVMLLISSLIPVLLVFTIKEADFSSLPQKDRPPSEVTDPMKGLKEMFDLIKSDGRRLLPTSQHLKVSSHLPSGFIPFAVTWYIAYCNTHILHKWIYTKPYIQQHGFLNLHPSHLKDTSVWSISLISSFFWNMICWIILDSFYLNAILPRFSYFIKIGSSHLC